MAEKLDYDPGAYEKLDYNPADTKTSAQKRGENRVSARSKDKGILRKVDAGVRGAADFLALGLADEASAAASAVPGLLTGGTKGFNDAYRANLTAEQAIDRADGEQVPVSRLVGQGAGFGAGLLGSGIVSASVRGPAAVQGLLRGGGMAGNMARGAVAGSALGAVQGAGSAAPGAENRIKGAQQGALVGGLLGTAAAPVAGLLARGGAAGINALARGRAGVGRAVGRGLQAATGVLDDTASTARRAMRYIGGDADQMATLAAERRAAGLEPSITDLTGDAGQRRIRAAGVRSQEAGATLSGRARALGAGAKPSVIERTRRLTGPETAEQAAERVLATRQANVRGDYAPAYATQINLSDDATRAIRSPAGQQAIDDAMAVASQRGDEGLLAELSALRTSGNGALPPVSGSTLDELQIFMGQNAENLATSAMSRNKRLAGAVRDSRGAIRTDLDTAPGLTEARANYADLSGQADIFQGKINGGDVPDFMTTDPADYRRFVEGLTDTQRQALAKRVQQDIVETLGGQRTATTGSLDTLTTAPFSRANLETALGPRAAPYTANVEGTLEGVQNARFVDPRGGSRTAVLTSDTENMTNGLVTTGFNVATGNKVGLARQAVDFLTSRQISKEVAEEVARIATDPARTDDAILLLQREAPGMEAIGLMRALRQLSTKPLAENVARAEFREVRRFTGPGGKPYVELEWEDGTTIEVPDITGESSR